MPLAANTTKRLRQALLILAMIYAAGMIIYPSVRLHKGSSDFLAFHRTARHLIDTGRITTDYGVRNYLPFFVILMTPFALLPAWLACALFNLLSIALLALCLVMINTWLLPRHPGSVLLRIGVPTLMVLPLITAALVLGQVILLVLFLMILGWTLFEQKRELPAGICFSLAVLIKAFPLIVLLFFLLKRRWSLLAGSVLGLLVFGVGTSLAVLGPQRTWSLHKDYFDRVVVGNSALTAIAAPNHRTLRYNNQSFPVVLRRLLRHTNAARDTSQQAIYVNIADLPPAIPQAIYLALAAAGLIGAAWIARKPIQQLPLQRLRFEFALFMLLALILSPLLWVRYLSLAIYPLCLLTVKLTDDRHAARPNRFGFATWIIWIVALPLLACPWCRAAGVHLWATLLLALAIAREALLANTPAADSD